MVVRNLMIHLLSILVSPKKLKSIRFLKYCPSFWFPYKTIYSNKKYTYCFKVFGISASTRNVSSFRVQIPLTASLDISFSDLVFPFCCCNHRFDSSLSDSLKCFVCTTYAGSYWLFYPKRLKKERVFGFDTKLKFQF